MSVQEDSDRLRAMVTGVMRGEVSRDAYVRERRQVIDAYAAEPSVDPLPEAPQTASHGSGTSDTVPVLKSTGVSGVGNVLVDVASDNPSVNPSGVAPSGRMDSLIGIVVVVAGLLVAGLLVAWIW